MGEGKARGHRAALLSLECSRGQNRPRRVSGWGGVGYRLDNPTRQRGTNFPCVRPAESYLDSSE